MTLDAFLASLPAVAFLPPLSCEGTSRFGCPALPLPVFEALEALESPRSGPTAERLPFWAPSAFCANVCLPLRCNHEDKAWRAAFDSISLSQTTLSVCTQRASCECMQAITMLTFHGHLKCERTFSSSSRSECLPTIVSKDAGQPHQHVLRHNHRSDRRPSTQPLALHIPLG